MASSRRSRSASEVDVLVTNRLPHPWARAVVLRLSGGDLPRRDRAGWLSGRLTGADESGMKAPRARPLAVTRPPSQIGHQDAQRRCDECTATLVAARFD